jgi:phosphate starvation-inducible protein PhoH
MKEKRKGIKPALKTGLKMGEISVLTDGHRDMIRCFLNGDITLGLGCAGTGKTFMAVALALREIFRPESPFSRIILVRSTCRAFSSTWPWCRPTAMPSASACC